MTNSTPLPKNNSKEESGGYKNGPPVENMLLYGSFVGLGASTLCRARHTYTTSLLDGSVEGKRQAFRCAIHSLLDRQFLQDTLPRSVITTALAVPVGQIFYNMVTHQRADANPFAVRQPIRAVPYSLSLGTSSTLLCFAQGMTLRKSARCGFGFAAFVFALHQIGNWTRNRRCSSKNTDGGGGKSSCWLFSVFPFC